LTASGVVASLVRKIAIDANPAQALQDEKICNQPEIYLNIPEPLYSIQGNIVLNQH
jgi:hypothetical protein